MSQVNTEELKAEYAGDNEILFEVINALLDSYSEKLEKLQAAIDSGNIKDIEFFSHNLKGAFLNFHAQSVSDRLKEIEFMAKDETIDGVSDKLKNLLPDIEQAISELKEIKDTLKF